MSNWREWLSNPNPSVLGRMARAGLWLGSVPYAGVVQLRNRFYDRQLLAVHDSPLPVISIGNLSVGGTGKSPMVAWVAKWLRNQELRVAVLSRGYGQLDDGRNDEALELELKLPDVPHLQHWDRIASARLAHDELDMQVLILDDGFQHRRISRDLDIVLIDATDSRAAQRLLPVGLRREPLSSLSRADIVVLTRADQASQSVLSRLEDQVKRYQPQAVLAHASHRASHLIAGYGQEIPLEQLRGAQVLAFCGIGNPAAFFEGLSRLGSRVLATRAWPDHHAYTAADIEWLRGWEQQNPDAKLVCTLKDWVKIQEARIGHRDLWALAIEIDFLTGQKAIEAQLGTIIPR